MSFERSQGLFHLFGTGAADLITEQKHRTMKELDAELVLEAHGAPFDKIVVSCERPPGGRHFYEATFRALPQVARLALKGYGVA